MLVHESVADELVALVLAGVKKLSVGMCVPCLPACLSACVCGGARAAVACLLQALWIIRADPSCLPPPAMHARTLALAARRPQDNAAITPVISRGSADFIEGLVGAAAGCRLPAVLPLCCCCCCLPLWGSADFIEGLVGALLLPPATRSLATCSGS